jgi:hypothetical protein
VISSRAGSPPREQGSGRRQDRAAVSGWIPMSAASEVGRERWLGQHDNVGNPIETSRGGVAHRRGVLVGGGGSVEEWLTGERFSLVVVVVDHNHCFDPRWSNCRNGLRSSET